MNFPHLNQTITIEIHGIGVNGEGVGRYDGYTVFINDALPGEIVRARLTECRKQYGKASLVSIEKPSPDRIIPPCALFGKCGGCQLMHLSYLKQLEIKRQRVADALARIGKLECVHVAPCLPSPLHLAYRNKIQLPVKQAAEGIVLGLYERSSHHLVALEKCHIHSSLGEAAYRAVRSIIKRSGISAYDPETGEGQLRHILIKSALRSQEVLVVLVTNGNAVDNLFRIAREIRDCCSFVKGVVHNKHSGKDNVILGGVYTVLNGSDSITETLCGLRFTISAASFFQVNPDQAERLYAKALEFAELTGEESVLDAYCGVGTLSLVFAQHTKNVIGVERVPGAIDDAKANAALNGIRNTRFVCSALEDFIGRHKPSVGIVLLNPPRKGCEPSVLEGIGRIAPRKVLYISCDPATLARDLARLAALGYSLEQIQPFDMFPQTTHVECVAKLRT